MINKNLISNVISKKALRKGSAYPNFQPLKTRITNDIVSRRSFLVSVYRDGWTALLWTNEAVEYGTEGCQDKDKDGYLAEIHAIGYGFRNTEIEAIDAIAYQSAPEQTDKDVAWIMHAKVYACPTVDQRPAYQKIR